MGRGPVEACPRCGCPVDAQPETYWLPPDDRRHLRLLVSAVRRELGLPTDSAAVLAAVSRVAASLHRGERPDGDLP